MSTMTEVDAKAAVREAIAKYVAFMNEACAEFMAERFPTLEADRFWVEGGKKYIKIAKGHNPEGPGASVHCFVDAVTGDVYKAATWKAPALNGARFNLLDEVSFEELKRQFDIYGRYLYKR